MNISTRRVEAFSDCVISIIITIMVFDIKFPLRGKFTNQEEAKELMRLVPRIITYFFSFLILGIMWINHHHMLHLIQKVDEKLLWLNLHLLFWMSLIPFPTSMLGNNPFLSESAAIYGAVLFMAYFALTLLRNYATSHKMMYIEQERQINRSIDRINNRAKIKGYIGTGAYLLSVPMSYVSVYISFACFTIPPILFFIPDGIEDEELAEKIIEVNETNV